MALVSYRGGGGENKSSMLKDYLRDDVSSCSSNGFRSFPRRQCCVAARSIIENEVIRNHNHKHKHNHHRHTKKRMPVKNNCNFSYAIQRASVAVVNAVKLLPFTTPVKKTDDNSSKKHFLPRSFSKKLFRRSFFRKKVKSTKKENSNNNNNNNNTYTKCDNPHYNEGKSFDDEIERWISSGVAGKEKYEPLDLSNDTTVTNNSSTSMSNSDAKSTHSRWSDITFSSDSSENDDVERAGKIEVSKIVAVIGVGGQSCVEPLVNQENVWFDEEVEKQHTSPISVLDFPDKDGGGFSPFTPQASRSKGTKEKLMKKLGRFEGLARLEPVNLESLFLCPKIQDHKPQCSIQPCSTPSYILSSGSEDEDEDEDDEGEGNEGQSEESEVEKNAHYLLNVTMSNNVTISSNLSYKFELENVLLDYFRQTHTQKESDSLLKAAEDWLNGHYDNLILGWEVKDKRQAYIRDMEEGGWTWPNGTKIEREEIGASIGDEIFAYLIQELMVDL